MTYGKINLEGNADSQERFPDYENKNRFQSKIGRSLEAKQPARFNDHLELDEDEKEVVNCLIEKVLIRERIIKYAKCHGVDLEGRPFEYDKVRGIVSY